MRKWFTLIEIMIVIAIITILMTITMRFGSKRIDDLGYQSGKEQFLSAYDKLYSQATTSNYHDGIRYDMLSITLGSGTNILSYAYDGEATEGMKFTIPLAISGMQKDGVSIDEVNLQIQPYVLGCSMMSSPRDEISTGASIAFDLVVKGQKHYCFSIHNDTCKLIEQKCE